MKMRKLTAEQVLEARALRDKGASFAALGRRFGVEGDTIQRAIDPEFLVRRREQAQEAKMRRKGAETRQRARVREAVPGPVAEADSAARLAEIPPDTRSLTQRICGDPLPQRSALFRKQQALS